VTFVETHRDTFGVAPLLAAIGEPLSTFYNRTGRTPSARAMADGAVAERIFSLWERSGRTCGAPRIHAMLARGRPWRARWCPPAAVTAVSRIESWRSGARFIGCGKRSQRRVLPSRSVDRKVRVLDALSGSIAFTSAAWEGGLDPPKSLWGWYMPGVAARMRRASPAPPPRSRNRSGARYPELLSDDCCSLFLPYPPNDEFGVSPASANNH
jgi:hypothetical protein